MSGAWTAAAVVGTSAVSGWLGADASKDAANTSANASMYGANLTNDQFLQTQENLSPWYNTGANALAQYSNYGRSRVNPNDYIPAFDASQFNLYMDPSYQFRWGEQNKAINANMAGMGKVVSGNRLDEIMKRSGEMASQEYGNAYNRQMNEYNMGVDAFTRAYGMESDYLNRLWGVAGSGQNAAAQLGAFGSNNANSIANMTQSAANAQAAGQIGAANAWSGALGDVASMYAMSQPPQMYYNNYSSQGPMMPPWY